MAEIPTQTNPLDPLIERALQPVTPTSTNSLSGALGQLGNPAANLYVPTPEEQEASRQNRARQILSDPNEMTRIAAAQKYGNDLANDPVVKDLSEMSYSDLVSRYGPDVADNAHLLSAAKDRFREDDKDDRSVGQVVGDTGLAVAQGFTNVVGGLAALGTGLVNDEAGVALAEETQKLSQSIGKLQSDERQRSSVATSLQQRLANEDNQEIHDATKSITSNESAFMSGLKHLGRNVVDTAEVLINNPDHALDLTGQGIGSLGPSIKIAQLAQKAATGSAVTGVQIANAINPTVANTAGALASRGVQASAVPIAIGTTEASGVYTDAVNRVTKMDEQTLLSGSAMYRDLRDQGLTHEEARTEVANQTGLVAAGRQLPTAALAGKLVQRFETGNFGTGIASVGRNTVSQGAEEAFQGATGSLNANIAIQQNADVEQDLSENVGQALVEGAVAGVGMSAAISAPNAAVSAVKQSTDAGVKLASSIARTREAQIEGSIDAANPVGREATAQNVQGVTESLSDAITNLSNSQNDADVILAQEVASIVNMPEAEIASMPESIRDLSVGEGDGSRIDRMVNLTNAIITGDIALEQEATAAVYLATELQKFQQFIVNPLPESITSRPENDPVRIAMENAQEQMSAIISSADVVEAYNRALEVDNSAEPTITNEVTPDLIDDVVRLSEVNPAGVNPEDVEVVLGEIEAGNLEVEPTKVNNLKAARELSQRMNDLAAQRLDIENKRIDTRNSQPASKGREENAKTLDDVSREILVDGKKAKNAVLRSVNDYYTDIIGSITSGGPVVNRHGEIVDAQGSMEALGKFAQHMQNKVNALNTSAEQGGKKSVSFNKLNDVGVFENDAGKITYNGHTANGLALAETVHADAQAVVDLYNSLLDIYGDSLSGNKIHLAGLTSTDSDISSVSTREERGVVQPTLVDETQVEEAVEETTQPKEEEAIEEIVEEVQEDTVEERTPQEEVVQEETDSDVYGSSIVNNERTQQDLDAYQKMHPDMSFGELNEEAKSFVLDALKPTLDRLGMAPEGALNDIVLIEDDSDHAIGIAFWEDAVLAVNPFLIENLDTLEGQHYLNHELFHLIDAKARTADGELASNIDAMKPFGRVYEEILQSMRDNEFMRVFFDYAMDQADDVTVANELFAELGALSQISPKLMKEYLPYGTEVLKAITERSGGVFEFGQEIVGDYIPKGATNFVIDQIGEDTVESDQETVTEVSEEENVVSEPVIEEDTVEPVTHPVEQFERLSNAVNVVEGKSTLVDSSFSDLVDNSVYDTDTKKLLKRIDEKYSQHIVDALNARLQNVRFNKKMTVAEAISNADFDTTNMRTYKNTTIVDPTTLKYDEALINQAVLAGLDWVINDVSSAVLDEEDVAKILGISENDVTSDILNTMNSGTYPLQAKEQLGRAILDFWGVEAKNTTTMSDTRGISEGIAAEILEVLQNDTNLIEEAKFDMIKMVDGKAITVPITTLVTQTEAQKDIAERLNGRRDAIKTLVNPQGKPTFYFDDIRPTPRTKQRRNSLTDLTARERKLIDTANNIVFKQNTGMSDLVEAFGDSRLASVLGSVDLTGRVVNKNHAKSLEGKNLSNAMSIAKLRNKINAIKEHAEETGKPVSEVEIRYQHDIIKSGRLMMNGYNPQSDKLAREVFTATNAILDLNDPAQVKAFWLTVAQSSDLVKVEKVGSDEAVAKVQKEIFEKYGDSIDVLSEWLDRNDGQPFSNEEFETIQNEVGETSVKVLHSLLAVAKYSNAVADNKLDNFEHNLSIEADGKTDGPINAMVHYMYGEFTQDQLDLLAKGGLFLNEGNKTLNEHSKLDGDDLYQVGAVRLKQYLRESYKDIKAKKPEAAQNLSALLRFMSNFGAIEIAGGEMTIGRNVLKNPLTVTVYGSGKAGITDKVVGEYIKAVYERMSDISETGNFGKSTYPEFIQDMETLFGSVTFYNKKKDTWNTFNNTGIPDVNNPAEFTFSPKNIENFTTTVGSLFTESLDEAIRDIMGGTIVPTKLVQSSTQIQSIVYRDLVEQAQEAELKAQRESGKIGKNDMLSDADYKKVMKDLQQYAPIIKNGDQEINMGTSEKSGSKHVMSSTMDDKYKQEGTLPVPSEAGVKSTAMLTINRGDALMVMDIYGENAPMNTLHVFDGIELPADKMYEYNKLINESVHKGWMLNPMADASKSFQDFLALDPMKDISDAARKQIAEILGDNQITDIAKDMESIANSIEARKRVMKKVTHSVDHMAGTESPFTNEGVVLNQENLIEELNDLMDQEMEALITEKAPKGSSLMVRSGLGRLGESEGASNPANADRIQSLIDGFEAQIGDFLSDRDIPNTDAVLKSRLDAVDNANALIAAGFEMTMQEKEAFMMVQSALAVDMKLNSVSMVRANKVYRLTMDAIAKGDLLEDAKLLALTEVMSTDTNGNSNLLSSFLALSQVNEEFRNVLAQIDTPKRMQIDTSTVDDALTSVTQSMMSSLTRIASGEKLSDRNTKDTLDSLSAALAAGNAESELYILKKGNELLSSGDHIGSNFLSRIGDTISDYANRGADKFKDQRIKALFQAADLAGQVLNSDKAGSVAEGFTSVANNTKANILVPFREQLQEIIGITDENAGVLTMVNKVKYAISSVRQDYRETLPVIMNNKFSRKLTKEEQKSLHTFVGMTDIGALGKGNSMKLIMEMLNNDSIKDKTINKLENEIRALITDRSTLKFVSDKVDQLAEFMMTGVAGDNLLRNAFAIAAIANKGTKTKFDVIKAEEILDKLITLYAVGKVSDADKAVFTDLMANERKGIEFMVYYQYGLKTDEDAKNPDGVAKMNGYKGYTPNEATDGSSLIVADDNQFNKLTKLGYKRIADYKGQGDSVYKKGYYFSASSPRNTYSQGALQTVQASYNGIDPRTGRSLTGKTAGEITGKLGTARKPNASEGYMPVFDKDGEITMWERAMDPEIANVVKRKDNMSEIMGVWAGRQIEEKMAEQFNEMLIDNMYDIYQKGSAENRTDEFINLADPKIDPVYKDAYNAIPSDMRNYIDSKFGGEGLLVRKDMVNNAVGYRNASVGDLWTGTTRFDSKTQKAITQAATMLMGKNAYKYLVTGETAVQTAVSAAKNTIVIRSMIVPAANMMANIIQLLTRGVSAPKVLRGMRTKLIEINAHLDNIDKRIELEAELKTAGRNPRRKKRLEAELRSLDDADRRMSIYPLIEAGEFSTISEGLTDADRDIMNGKFMEWVEAQVDKLPNSVKTVGKYVLIARDTALYKGMSRAVQYGDFLGKAIYFDHMLDSGKQEGEALQEVSEEFVNFNLLPGRTRTYAESMGLTWFWAFKIRSMKVALRIARDNPLRALMLTGGVPNLPIPSGFGSPLTDNFLSVAEDGRLDYSIGWNMLFQAPQLNPWLNVSN